VERNGHTLTPEELDLLAPGPPTTIVWVPALRVRQPREDNLISVAKYG
jgi:hypothetical protein